MNHDRPVHQYAPAGSERLPCCGRLVDDVRTGPDRISSIPHDVTCTERRTAELLVDTDDGESPFGWREPDAAPNLVPTPQPQPNESDR